MAASLSFRILSKRLKIHSLVQNKSMHQTAPCCIMDIKREFIAHEIPEKETFPRYEVSTEEFKYVEKLLPPTTVPKPPVHSSYPTPSGWLPPDREKTSVLPYSIERNKNHMLPVYMKQKGHRGIKVITVIRGVHGDIFQMEKDLRSYLEETCGPDPVLTEVSEVTRRVTIKGNMVELVGKWLVEKGF